MCITLGGQSGSADLRDWASRELRGYQSLDDLPRYRKIAAPILVDGVKGNSFNAIAIKGQRISPGVLPDVVAQHISEEVNLTQPIGEIEGLSKNGESVHFSLPGGADVARLMNYEPEGPSSVIQQVYWSVSPTVLASVVDQVRTRLIELTAEMRAGLDDKEGLPSATAVDAAVEIAIYGNGNRVNVSNNKGVDNSVETAESATGGRHGSTLVKVFGALVGLATIAGSAVAVYQLLR